MNKSKQIIKRIVDFAMILLLPVLMAEILIGQEIHEWLGVGMLALFLAHHLLNPGWWKSFAKGRYTPSRAFQTALDLLLLADMIALFAGGIMMSGFVFKFLHIGGGMMTARQLHLFASYWGLILMSAHLGVHIGQFFPLFRKMFRLSEKNAARTWVLRILAAALSAYGVYAFAAQRMTDYLFLQTHFVLFDETKAAAVYFAEIIAMMCLFAAMAYYLNKLLCKVGRKSKKEQSRGKRQRNDEKRGTGRDNGRAAVRSLLRRHSRVVEKQQHMIKGLPTRIKNFCVNNNNIKKERIIMSKTLVAYFSASGTTAGVAKDLASAIGADLYRIQPAVPYTQADLNWMNKKSRSSIEMNDKSSRPELSDADADVAAYDTIYLGFPIWWYVAPTIINTFLESYDFSGKKIVLFATSGGSGFGKTAAGLKPSVSPDTEIVEGEILNSASALKQWEESL